MSFLLRCPNCGPRDVSEFRYGGQILAQPPAGGNLPEVQHERWYHRYGCRRWLTASLRASGRNADAPSGVASNGRSG